MERFVLKFPSRSFQRPKTSVEVVFTRIFIEIYMIFAVFRPMLPHISLRAAVSGNHCASQKPSVNSHEHIHLGEYGIVRYLHMSYAPYCITPILLTEYASILLTA